MVVEVENALAHAREGAGGSIRHVDLDMETSAYELPLHNNVGLQPPLRPTAFLPITHHVISTSSIHFYVYMLMCLLLVLQLHALVARGNVILAEHQGGSRDFSQGTYVACRTNDNEGDTAEHVCSNPNHSVQDSSQQQQAHVCLGTIPLPLCLRGRIHILGNGR